jgi:putative Holliday junction resolvase
MDCMNRVLGIDPGEARIGIAVSDDLNMLAHPVVTLSAKDDPIEKIRAIIAEKGVDRIVIGVPRNMDGTYGPAAEKSRAFADLLKEKLGLPVIKWDERLTTVAAQRALHEAGRNSKQQKSVIDQAAAQIILQGWLDGPGSAL